MTPNDVIESYVRDVARNLPGKMRYEVATDLRAQLNDELAGRAEVSGRAPDEALALGLVRDFGQPEDLAVRYHPPFAIIEPANTRRFIVICVIGYGMLETIVVTLRRLGSDAAQDFDQGALGWIGLMTIIFGLRTWLRARHPERHQWRPKPKVFDLDKANYAKLAVSALATLFFMAAYLWPGPMTELVTGGRVQAQDVAYTASFADPASLRKPWLVVVLALGLVLQAFVAFRGRWTRLTRWLYIFFLFHVAFQLGWHMAYGPVFQSPQVEKYVFAGASLLILGIGIALWLRVLREWDWIAPPKALRNAPA